MVLHVTRHIVKAMDVATIRSVKTGGGTKASVCWLSQHTAKTLTTKFHAFCFLLLCITVINMHVMPDAVCVCAVTSLRDAKAY